MKNDQAFIQTIKLCKSFGKVQVLKGVDFDIRPGEVHALMGENGAGKSTLMNVLFGVYPITSGKVLINGQECRITNPIDAKRHGMAMIHQEPLTFKDMSILENIFAGCIDTRLMNWKALETRGREIMDSLGIPYDIHRKVMGLSVADMQKIEIANVLVGDAKVVFMDEPTASLTPDEVDALLDIIRTLTRQGKSVVYVSHRLEEVERIADRITIMRNGVSAGTYDARDISKAEMVRLMIGRSMDEFITKTEVTYESTPYFSVEHIGVDGCFSDVSFDVAKGEIVGLAGLVGAGRTETARGIFGITPIQHGKIRINGREVVIRNPKQAIRNGIALLPEDRQGLGLLTEFAISYNSTFSIPEKIRTRYRTIDKKRERELTDRYAKLLRLKCDGYHQKINELSGGNQQKVSIAKWLLTDPDILILDEPTRGIDIGAKAEVYKLICELAAQGKCIIMISSEQAEIVGLCDKVIVMYEGRMSATLKREELTMDAVLMASHNMSN